MKIFLSTVVSAFALQAAPLCAAEQIVTLGDSLTFAYEAEFGFRITIPFVGTYGDGFGPEVQNWIEILHDTTYRNNYFDQGSRDEVTVSLLFSTKDLFFRREHNWAVPGMKIDQLRRFLNQEATVHDILSESPEFSVLVTALDNSDFQNSDFDVLDLENQIQNTAERLTLFIGGNDINQAYGDIYNGLGAGSFVSDFIADATWIINYVQTLNPDIQIVLVNVPHVGITPDVKATYPTDTIKTERVTSVLRDLNSQLNTLATSKNIGYADIFTGTLPLIHPNPLCIHGITFNNTGSTSGDLDYVWLNGPLSANFHPNTNAHTIIANEIIHAFNRHYQTGIAPLTATEALVGLHGKTPAEIDMSFSTWMNGYGLSGLPSTDDTDLDGLHAGLEFTLGLNPTLDDAEFFTQSLINDAGTPKWQLAYPERLPASNHYTLAPTQSAGLETFLPLSSTSGSDGRTRATIPISGNRNFLRLEATLTP